MQTPSGLLFHGTSEEVMNRVNARPQEELFQMVLSHIQPSDSNTVRDLFTWFSTILCALH